MQSMTGYGRVEKESRGLAIKVEIKSLNSKFLDISLKNNSIFHLDEFEVRNRVQSALQRGKVMVSLSVDSTEGDLEGVNINTGAFMHYYQKLLALCDQVGSGHQDLVRITLGLPGMVQPEEQDISSSQQEVVFKTIDEALEHVIEFRLKEGESLKKDMLESKSAIAQGAEDVKKRLPARQQRQREQLQASLDQQLPDVSIDKDRFEQELIYYLEKLDINEELVRLSSHLDYFQEAAENENNAGKKLNFIAQEMGREINTLGAKAYDAEIQKIVIGMKEELEKIKEQILNVL